MSIFRLSLRVALIATAFIWVHGQDELGKALVPKSSAHQAVLNAIKSPGLTVVHLWAPWCSNCQAELKTGGWLKTIKDSPQV
jgi:thiol-disulfide isomerase/thioredoxin